MNKQYTYQLITSGGKLEEYVNFHIIYWEIESLVLAAFRLRFVISKISP